MEGECVSYSSLATREAQPLTAKGQRGSMKSAARRTLSRLLLLVNAPTYKSGSAETSVAVVGVSADAEGAAGFGLTAVSVPLAGFSLTAVSVPLAVLPCSTWAERRRQQGQTSLPSQTSLPCYSLNLSQPYL